MQYRLSSYTTCRIVEGIDQCETCDTATLHPFNGLFSRTTWVSRYQKGKNALDLNEARDDGDGGGISWTIGKQSVPRSRQITTPTPHHSIFTGGMFFVTPNRRKYRLSVDEILAGWSRHSSIFIRHCRIRRLELSCLPAYVCVCRV